MINVKILWGKKLLAMVRPKTKEQKLISLSTLSSVHTVTGNEATKPPDGKDQNGGILGPFLKKTILRVLLKNRPLLLCFPSIVKSSSKKSG